MNSPKYRSNRPGKRPDHLPLQAQWLIGVLRLTRPHNCFGAAMAVCLGIYLAANPNNLLAPVTLQTASLVWLIVAACNVFNDYCDLATDSLSKPHRSLPAGRVSLKAAKRLTWGLAISGVVVGYTLGGPIPLIALVMLILGLGYSYILKSSILLGNGVVGLLSGATVLFGGYVMGQITWPVRIAGFLICLFVFAREILKTVADRDGDALTGVRTVATSWGQTRALRLFKVLAILFMGATLLPWAFSLAPQYYLYAALPFIVLPTMGVVILLQRAAGHRTIRLSLWITKMVWFSGLLSMGLLK